MEGHSVKIPFPMTQACFTDGTTVEFSGLSFQNFTFDIRILLSPFGLTHTVL